VILEAGVFGGKDDAVKTRGRGVVEVDGWRVGRTGQGGVVA
jgi:hypothetical protein